MSEQMALARSASGRCRNRCRCPNRPSRSRRSADLRPACRATAQSRGRRAPRRAAGRAPARVSAAGSPRGGYRRYRGRAPAPTSAPLRSRQSPMATGGSSTPPHARAYPRRSRRMVPRSVAASACAVLRSSVLVSVTDIGIHPPYLGRSAAFSAAEPRQWLHAPRRVPVPARQHNSAFDAHEGTGDLTPQPTGETLIVHATL